MSKSRLSSGRHAARFLSGASTRRDPGITRAESAPRKASGHVAASSVSRETGTVRRAFARTSWRHARSWLAADCVESSLSCGCVTDRSETGPGRVGFQPTRGCLEQESNLQLPEFKSGALPLSYPPSAWPFICHVRNTCRQISLETAQAPLVQPCRGAVRKSRPSRKRFGGASRVAGGEWRVAGKRPSGAPLAQVLLGEGPGVRELSRVRRAERWSPALGAGLRPRPCLDRRSPSCLDIDCLASASVPT